MMTTGSENKDEAVGHQLQSKQREILSETTSKRVQTGDASRVPGRGTWAQPAPVRKSPQQPLITTY